VGNEPFAVLLPDDLMWNRGDGALKQMADLAERTGGGVIAVEQVPHEKTSSYGIVATRDFEGRSGRIVGMVEKPRPEDAPSDLAVVGRYILPGGIFEALETTERGAGGEIQLTDAIASYIKGGGHIDAYHFEGRRFDCGAHIGLIEATVHFALEHPRHGAAARGAMQAALDEKRG
jgi:UTP--glucose-1-phosphate uridylyltransferase